MNEPTDIIQDILAADEPHRYEIFLRLYRPTHDGQRMAFDSVLTQNDPLPKILFLRYLEEISEPKSVLAILSQIGSDNKIIAEAAETAYLRNHYPQKSRLLIPHINSSSDRAARFAIRTLSRLGAAEILPSLLQALPDSREQRRVEIIKGLRFIPDQRAIPLLLPLTDSSDENVRYQSVRTLLEYLRQGYSLPARLFLPKLNDPSIRVSRAARMALSYFSSNKIASKLMESISNDNPATVRMASIQALSAFPNTRWVPPLLLLATRDSSPEIRLACEISLKRFPKPVIKRSLVSLLRSPEKDLRLRAALMLADLFGDDPEIHNRLINLWHRMDTPVSKLNFLQVIGRLQGESIIEILARQLKENPLTAYTASSLLNKKLSADHMGLLWEILSAEQTSIAVRQALLGVIAKRGPGKGDLSKWIDHLVQCLQHADINIRYLTVQALVHFPLDASLTPLLDLMLVETDETIREAGYHVLWKRSQGNPALLLKTARTHKQPVLLIPHLAAIFKKDGWQRARLDDIIQTLSADPFLQNGSGVSALIGLFIDWIEKAVITPERAWNNIQSEELRPLFLERLSDALQEPERRFPQLDFFFVLKKYPSNPLTFQLIGLSRNPALLSPYLSHALQLTHPEQRREAGRYLNRLIWGRTP